MLLGVRCGNAREVDRAGCGKKCWAVGRGREHFCGRILPVPLLNGSGLRQAISAKRRGEGLVQTRRLELTAGGQREPVPGAQAGSCSGGVVDVAGLGVRHQVTDEA